MTAGPVICDASPVIVFEQIGRLDLLKMLFGQVVIPPAVAAEFRPTLATLPHWIRVVAPVSIQVHAPWSDRLGDGEMEAISLAVERHAQCLVVDDRDARINAQSRGLVTTGSLGVLLAAKRRGCLSAVEPVIGEMLKHCFHVDDLTIRTILFAAGELDR